MKPSGTPRGPALPAPAFGSGAYTCIVRLGVTSSVSVTRAPGATGPAGVNGATVRCFVSIGEVAPARAPTVSTRPTQIAWELLTILPADCDTNPRCEPRARQVHSDTTMGAPGWREMTEASNQYAKKGQSRDSPALSVTCVFERQLRRRVT